MAFPRLGNRAYYLYGALLRDERYRHHYAAHAVMAQMQCAEHATVLKGAYTPRQVLALIDEFDLDSGWVGRYFTASVCRQQPAASRTP